MNLDNLLLQIHSKAVLSLLFILIAIGITFSIGPIC